MGSREGYGSGGELPFMSSRARSQRRDLDSCSFLEPGWVAGNEFSRRPSLLNDNLESGRPSHEFARRPSLLSDNMDPFRSSARGGPSLSSLTGSSLDPVDAALSQPALSAHPMRAPTPLDAAAAGVSGTGVAAATRSVERYMSYLSGASSRRPAAYAPPSALAIPSVAAPSGNALSPTSEPEGNMRRHRSRRRAMQEDRLGHLAGRTHMQHSRSANACERGFMSGGEGGPGRYERMSMLSGAVSESEGAVAMTTRAAAYLMRHTPPSGSVETSPEAAQAYRSRSDKRMGSAAAAAVAAVSSGYDSPTPPSSAATLAAGAGGMGAMGGMQAAAMGGPVPPGAGRSDGSMSDHLFMSARTRASLAPMNRRSFDNSSSHSQYRRNTVGSDVEDSRQLPPSSILGGDAAASSSSTMGAGAPPGGLAPTPPVGPFEPAPPLVRRRTYSAADGSAEVSAAGMEQNRTFLPTPPPRRGVGEPSAPRHRSAALTASPIIPSAAPQHSALLFPPSVSLPHSRPHPLLPALSTPPSSPIRPLSPPSPPVPMPLRGCKQGEAAHDSTGVPVSLPQYPCPFAPPNAPHFSACMHGWVLPGSTCLCHLPLPLSLPPSTASVSATFHCLCLCHLPLPLSLPPSTASVSATFHCLCLCHLPLPLSLPPSTASVSATFHCLCLCHLPLPLSLPPSTASVSATFHCLCLCHLPLPLSLPPSTASVSATFHCLCLCHLPLPLSLPPSTASVSATFHCLCLCHLPLPLSLPPSTASFSASFSASPLRPARPPAMPMRPISVSPQHLAAPPPASSSHHIPSNIPFSMYSFPCPHPLLLNSRVCPTCHQHWPLTTAQLSPAVPATAATTPSTATTPAATSGPTAPPAAAAAPSLSRDSSGGGPGQLGGEEQRAGEGGGEEARGVRADEGDAGGTGEGARAGGEGGGEGGNMGEGQGREEAGRVDGEERRCRGEGKEGGVEDGSGVENGGEGKGGKEVGREERCGEERSGEEKAEEGRGGEEGATAQQGLDGEGSQKQGAVGKEVGDGEQSGTATEAQGAGAGESSGSVQRQRAGMSHRSQPSLGNASGSSGYVSPLQSASPRPQHPASPPPPASSHPASLRRPTPPGASAPGSGALSSAPGSQRQAAPAAAALPAAPAALVPAPPVAVQAVLGSEQWTIDFNELRLGIRVGIGSFGEVFRAVWRGTEVAVKRLLVQDDPSPEEYEDFYNEVSLLSRLRHPNGTSPSPPRTYPPVSLHAPLSSVTPPPLFFPCPVPPSLVSCIHPAGCTAPQVCMVTEYMHMGSLYRIIHSREPGQGGESLSWKRRYKMLRDICRWGRGEGWEGVKLPSATICSPPPLPLTRFSLHLFSATRGMLCVQRMSIVHRDLKSANCLVDKHWCVKICDFGLSRLAPDGLVLGRTAAGTPEWMAPELLRNEPCSFKCDVFSMGVIMWELVTLRRPWEDVKNPLEVCVGGGGEGGGLGGG
ncbi:unnamed protein product [Closterium sp. Naga37s-1]|nr:unnamed protein product [Closterium sp. Naga37s-1]